MRLAISVPPSAVERFPPALTFSAVRVTSPWFTRPAIMVASKPCARAAQRLSRAVAARCSKHSQHAALFGNQAFHHGRDRSRKNSGIPSRGFAYIDFRS
jgi:hypothetical protein